MQMPLLVFGGRADSVAPVQACEAMAAPQPDRVRLVVYDYLPHTFDMRLPDRTTLGMRLGFDAQATRDARQRVVAFLQAHGMVQ